MSAILTSTIIWAMLPHALAKELLTLETIDAEQTTSSYGVRHLSKPFTNIRIPVRHPAQLLFAFPGLPKDGFPFTLLSSIAFHRIWLNRCAARFERDHVPPRVLLGLILDDFSTACWEHFSTLRLSRS